LAEASFDNRRSAIDNPAMTYELGIIGAGNMAEAIARGVIASGLYLPQQIFAADPSAARLDLFRNELGVRTTDDNAEVAQHSRILLLSVKPQMMRTALEQLRSAITADALLISIAAGISTALIETAIGTDRRPRVIRCMPNTPMLVGAGMSALSRGRHATDDDLARATRIFSAAGQVLTVDESHMDAVTAVSGSGPAYFFFLVEQMIAAGVSLGLTDTQARQLAAQTALGAATMLTTTPDTPAELRRKVTSPNGTTHAAITYLESNGWPTITADAVRAAAKRSAELSQG
jgi:pyrroline-5-carboxylate reductase